MLPAREGRGCARPAGDGGSGSGHRHTPHPLLPELLDATDTPGPPPTGTAPAREARPAQDAIHRGSLAPVSTTSKAVRECALPAFIPRLAARGFS